jgi:hypothetical protein
MLMLPLVHAETTASVIVKDSGIQELVLPAAPARTVYVCLATS